jgi:hypothetical protein
MDDKRQNKDLSAWDQHSVRKYWEFNVTDVLN